MPKIDVSGVPAEKLTSPEFLSLQAQMNAALLSRAWISAFCIHEAGHITYLTALGVTEYLYTGPQIVYDSQRDVFDGSMAAVKPKAIPEATSLENLVTVAKALVAGGTFARNLTNAPDTGDEEDRDRFDQMCALMEEQCNLPKGAINCQESWEEARKAVLIDLRSPPFRTKAWETARDIESRLFS